MVKIIHVSDRRRWPFRAAKQFELTERDRLLFDWLVAFEAMTRDHVARLWGINHSGASKRIRLLRDKGFIDDKSVFTGFPSILTITSKGCRHSRWTHMTDKGNVVGDFKPPRFNTGGTLAHTLLVMDFALSWSVYGHTVVSERVMKAQDRKHLNKGNHHPIYAIDRYKADAKRYYYPDFLSLPDSVDDSNSLVCAPDARKPRPGKEQPERWPTRDSSSKQFLHLMIPKTTGAWAVEVERSRKTTKRYRHLSRAYEASLIPYELLPDADYLPLAQRVMWYVADTGTRTRIDTAFSRSREERGRGRSQRKISWSRDLEPWLAAPTL